MKGAFHPLFAFALPRQALTPLSIAARLAQVTEAEIGARARTGWRKMLRCALVTLLQGTGARVETGDSDLRQPLAMSLSCIIATGHFPPDNLPLMRSAL
jgi:hypothetical protein